LSHSISISILVAPIKDALSQITVLFLENLGGFLSKDRLEGSAHLDVSLQSLHGEVNLEGLVLEPMHVDNVLGNIKILLVYLFILNDEEEVKS
jgi:hypothetical protein